MSTSTQAPVFIGGLMKSGTSLLRKLLSLHPNLFGGLETHWFTDDFVEHWQDGQSTRQQWLGQFFDVSEQKMENIRERSGSAYDFLDNFMHYCTQRAGKKRWIEKTPDNVFHMDTIRKYWPQAKILIMQRDLRDVYASWKKNKKRNLENFLEVATQFKNIVQSQKDKEHLLTVSYFDLVIHTKKVLEEILNFIDEPYIDGLENYQGDNRDYEKVLAVTGKISPTTASLKKPIFTNSIGQWEEILNHQEILRIEEIQ